MEDRFDDEDRDALAAITNGTSYTLKTHSLSNHHRLSTGGSSVSVAGAGQKFRKHSLDEGRIAAHHHYNSRDSLSSNSSHSSRYDFSASLPTTGCPAHDGDALPEFMASGGTGIFRAPTRSAVHPGRPPAVELRPHPLRETQVGRFLRTIGCTETQLWAGQENGVRFWNFREAYEAGGGLGGRVKRGDEDAAPFYESGNCSPTLCLVVDQGNGIVWTGHKDGKIRSWKMDHNFDDHDDGGGDDSTPFREGLSWTAHKGPVLCLVMSSYGDLWSGSEGGVVKVWPWEAVEKSLSLSPEEKHMAALLVERAYIDLRSQVTVNGVCNISSSDVKAMLSDHARGRVWCATSLSFSLWDARTKELVKVFNIEGQIENRVEMPVLQDQAAVEDEMKVKFVSSTKKEKPHGFLQRSRNAIMGAADAVRRVATRGTGAFNEDSKKTEALILTADGTIWSGCSNGLLVHWDGNGNRIQDFNNHPSAILCFCTHGTRLWVGYASGVMQLLDLDGNIIKGWVAHTSPVIKMAIGGGYVFSLAVHGGIRGWHLTSPGPIDDVIRTALAAKELSYTRLENLKILVGTWNVGQGKPVHEALRLWLGSAVSDVGIVVVGLQEVEMGAGFLAMSAAKETVGLEGSAIGNLWQDAIGKVLGEGSNFERVGSRQLAGLLIAIWVRKDLRMHVGDLDAAAVACGLGRTIGNKGGVGLSLRVHDRIICFVNCHLAAHLEAVNRRNADFDHIFRTMVFSRQSNSLSAGASSTSQMPCTASAPSGNSDHGRPELSDADMVIFCGDFNYRLYGMSYDEARDFVSQRSFDWLREKDQLRAEMKAGKVFQGMREAVITFPPTYKFEKHVPGLGGYDSGEKKRIPAWCDRVIYRDCLRGPVSECSLDCPILGSVQMYEACMDVTESDHKPVRCKLNVRLAHADRSVRRIEFGEIMNNSEKVKAVHQELPRTPETTISTDRIVLQNQETCSLRITNKSLKDKAAFHILCEGQAVVNDGQEHSDLRPRGSFGFPTWLEVTPASGIVKPEDTIEVLIRQTESQTLGDLVESIPHNWWSEDTRDKEVLLRVQVQGTSSLETRTHQIRVHHRYSANTTRISESRTNSSRRGSSGSQRRSESHHRHHNRSDLVDRG